MTRDEAVAKLVPRLVELYDPLRIYLFGSTARGEAQEHSDLDFMVVLPDEAPKELFWSSHKLDRNGIPYTPEIHTWRVSGFDRHLPLRASFPSTIVDEGRLLYDSTGLLSEATREWTEKAQKDLRGARKNYAIEEYETAAFLCQQSAEKSAKAFLTWHNVRFPKTHSLEELAAMIASIDPSLHDELMRAKALTPYAWIFRYPGTKEVATPQLVENAIARAEAVYQAVLQRLPENAHPFVSKREP
jgi:HEPN domain-containing protein